MIFAFWVPLCLLGQKKFGDWKHRFITFDPNEISKIKLSILDFLKKLTDKDFTLCPCCDVGHLGGASTEKEIAQDFKRLLNGAPSPVYSNGGNK